MSLVELLLIAVAVSMDAFAVSICKGLCLKKRSFGLYLQLGLAFGIAQAAMPLIGYLLGASFIGLIAPVDHWVAFLLLAYLGARMLKEALSEETEGEDSCPIEGSTLLPFNELFMLAIATSIDALIVGLSFAALQVNIWQSISLIGICTCGFSMFGVWVGSKFGSMWEKPSSIAGAIILILIGLKTLLSHLGFINF